MDQVNLRAEPRMDYGTRTSRRLRRSGSVPAIVYGRGLDPVSVMVGQRDLYAALHTEAGTNALINLDVAGAKKFLTVAREIQRHPVRGEILHLDFINISLDEKIHAEVGLEFHGIPTGVKVDAGIVETVRSFVEVFALPLDIPAHIPFDISDMEVGDTLTIADLPVIAGVEYVDDPATTLLNVIIPRIAEASAADIAAEAEVAAVALAAAEAEDEAEGEED
ncbi:MAG TPA: 50S ribosomal protein L25 [Acidimicrobiia bacterium]|nr:50S ribosomal protein L25 [Acidimicrobiia bacterium]